jgi:hypothetical protein
MTSFARPIVNRVAIGWAKAMHVRCLGQDVRDALHLDLRALGLKAFFLATTVFGDTTLWVTILADAGATVLVTENALRLLRHGRNAMAR